MKEIWLSSLLNIFTTILKVMVYVVCIFVFALVLPIAVDTRLSELLRPGESDMDLAITTLLSMFATGLTFGIHAAMLVTQRTILVKDETARFAFVLVSALYVLCIVLFDSFESGMLREHSLPYLLRYFFSVQVPPLLWFVYNIMVERNKIVRGTMVRNGE